jgi:hypothetical protein
MSTRAAPLLVALVISGLTLGTAGAQDAPIGVCTPMAARPEPASLLRDMGRAMGVGRVGAGTLHLRMTDATLEDYQSDRTYPPYFLGFTARETWYRPGTGVARHASRISFPFNAGDFPPQLSGANATFQARDALVRPAPSAHGGALGLRGMDPWAQLYDWSHGSAVSLRGRCVVRD